MPAKVKNYTEFVIGPEIKLSQLNPVSSGSLGGPQFEGVVDMVVEWLDSRRKHGVAAGIAPIRYRSEVGWYPSRLPFLGSNAPSPVAEDAPVPDTDTEGKALFGKGFTLMIAEDNEADLYLIDESLNNAGLQFEAYVASDGEKAMLLLERLAQFPASWRKGMILDLNLTTHSGFEILQKARSIPRLSRVPIVVLTSSNSPEDRRRAEVLRADAYFCKPLDLEEFMQVGRDIADIFRYGVAERL